MQKVLIGFFAVTTAVLSVACGVLWAKLRSTEERARAFEQARAAEADLRVEQQARVAELERREARLERQVTEFARVTTTLRSNETAQSSNLVRLAERVRSRSASSGTNASGGVGKGMGEMLGAMMKDPSMREMMREQQKAAINMMYAGLFKELNLTSEEKEKLRSLLTDAQMRNIEAAQGLFGQSDTAGASDATAQITAAKKQSDEEVRALLGDERYAQFEDYQKSMGERMQLDQFKSKMAGENLTLRDDQSASLLQILKDERLAVPPVIASDQTQIPQRDLFTQDKIEKQTQWLEDYNRRVAERVRNSGVLTPEQIPHFLSFQEQQTAMQKLGLNMARQMFGGNNDTGSSK